MMAEDTTKSSAGLTPFFLIAALLPVVGYLGSIGFAEAQRLGAPTIEVAIEGHDPRDIVRGHYLNYLIALEPDRESAADAHEQKSRYSYNQACATSGGVRGVILFNEARPESCTAALPADFIREPHRFYVQQDQAQAIERAVQEGRATVVLRVISERTVVAEQLLVDGRIFGER